MFTIHGNMTYKVSCDTYKVTLTIGYILIWVYIQGNIWHISTFFDTYKGYIDMTYKTPQTGWEGGKRRWL